jgi:hypothetical protein
VAWKIGGRFEIELESLPGGSWQRNGGHRKRGEALRCPPVHGPPCGGHLSIAGRRQQPKRGAEITAVTSALKRFDDDPAGLFRGPADRDLAAVQSHPGFVRREKLKKEAGDNSGLQRRCPFAASLIASGHYPRKAARCHFESAADGPGFPSHSAVKEQPPPWPKNSTDCSQ